MTTIERRPGRRVLTGAAPWVALWVVLTLPVAASLGSGRPLWLPLGGAVALGGVLAVLGRWPLAALLVACALTAVNGNFAFALPVVSYLVGLRCANARPVGWAFGLAFAGGAALNLLYGVAVENWFPLTVWLVLLGVLPWLAGRYWRQYQEVVKAGWQRAEQLEHEQRIIAEQERLRERARIAHDMHDSLGHELSLIALRAGALEVAADLGEGHRAAAGELRATATTATERLQEIIGVLRDGSGPAPREPVHESIPALVERARASGMALTFHEHGAGAPPPPMADRAAYRVVQEALTNATKHAPGAAVTVRLDHALAQTTVTVTNAAPPAGPLPGRTQGRRGLTGLRERARLTGGSLDAGPNPGGGFNVTAHLPHTPGTGAATQPPEPGEQAGERTESAGQFEERRHRLRRELVRTVAAPAALLAGLGAVMVGYHVYATLNSVLDPADYRRLSIGQPRAEVEAVLPARRLLGGPPAEGPAPPPGAACLHYRSDANLLGLGEVYRLCFTGGRLAAKDTLRPAQGGR